eukprot:TRINITY_DN8626_c0_g2_i4.p1 TRINITY_DN8626_c0_g2~~TRINITY_DN8626_c0_g2_i4.p1  ORF type:complete len:436 (+),score=86.16 TRINITY_DN8626_c0_g2_i4:1-1308(+)
MMAQPKLLTFADHGTFATETLKTRMPTILTKAIDYLYRHLHHLEEATVAPDELRKAQGAISILSKLKYEMQTKKVMRDIDGNGPDAAQWNRALKEACTGEENPKWWECTWLLSECYMYRRIHEACLSAELFRDLDPFQESKDTSFECSLEGIAALGKFMLQECRRIPDLAVRKQGFELMLQFSLWGNKSDLSLMADFDGSTSLSHLQGGTKDHLADQLHRILTYDFEAVWQRVAQCKDDRIDIVLDNSGFEVFCDLCLADWLTQAGYASEIRLHGKAFPWFVSDVTESDLTFVVSQLCKSEEAALKSLGIRWREYIKNKTWVFEQHPFWTFPDPYWRMQELAPDLYRSLAASKLVIFKGDLNYRKLVGDLEWPHDTAFATSLQGFQPTAICALRALKCPTLAGVKKEAVARAQKESQDWMTTGEFAVVQFAEPSS